MEKIKASDATCQQLNWLVGTIEGRKPTCYGGVIRASGHPDFPDSPPVFGPELLYATDPAQAQEIIDRCNIKTRFEPGGESAKTWEASDVDDFDEAIYGATREMAALRWFVATELGEHVEVPDELVSQGNATTNGIAAGAVYDHAFTIAFTVVSRNDAESVTAQELRAGLSRRMRELHRREGYDEIVEACGLPHDTFVYGANQSFQLEGDTMTNEQHEVMVYALENFAALVSSATSADRDADPEKAERMTAVAKDLLMQLGHANRPGQALPAGLGSF